MKKARIVIGANYGDEGKGTVVAHYTKHSSHVLNVLTNGGSQRGHSILTDDGSITFQHFGSGTYHGAHSYYSRYFIMNPMQFVQEYEALIVKPQKIYRDRLCRWSTPYDVTANLIGEELQGRHASCGMGIWNTIKRCDSMPIMLFDEFVTSENQFGFLNNVKAYYEKFMDIPDAWKSIWNSPTLQTHFINDCLFMAKHTEVARLPELEGYENFIFENGQGLLLCDQRKDTPDTTPSNTGILYSLKMLKEMNSDIDITAHYVTRPYLTRHGDGEMEQQSSRTTLSKDVAEDRTNQYNEHQGEFRYGLLDVNSLKQRITEDATEMTSFIFGDDKKVNIELEVTHCDEMDRIAEFKKEFNTVNTYDSALIK